MFLFFISNSNKNQVRQVAIFKNAIFKLILIHFILVENIEKVLENVEAAKRKNQSFIKTIREIEPYLVQIKGQNRRRQNKIDKYVQDIEDWKIRVAAFRQQDVEQDMMTHIDEDTNQEKIECKKNKAFNLQRKINEHVLSKLGL